MNKKSIKTIILTILSMLLIIIGGTFAWLSWRSQNTAMVLTIGDIRGLTVTLKPYQINKSLSPVSSYTDGVVIDVNAANAKNEVDSFKLFYKIVTIDNALKDEGFKYTITKCMVNCENASNYTVLNDAGGNFVGAANNSNLQIYSEEVPANTTYHYKVYLWIDSSSGNQSNMQNKSFVGELNASITSSPYSIMRDNAVIDNQKSTYVTGTSGISFSSISSDTNGKGVYIRKGTENDPFPIYYYRGAVIDNNVLFAGFCWKMVRTTSTGGTKLIYNGIPTGENNNQCENTTGAATRLASTSKYNSYNGSLGDIGYMSGVRYPNSSKNVTNNSDTYMYGTGYDAANNKLVVTDAINFAGTDWSTNYTQLKNNHYTCYNTSGECEQVKYIYYATNSTSYYLTIPNGKTISDIRNETLVSLTNTTDSTIKTLIDTWYETNMTSYTDKLEDTPYCNDRTIYSLAGWSPTGSITGALRFSTYNRGIDKKTPLLTCNTNDAFTVNISTGNGKLTYPVGLLTVDEIMLAGGKVSTDNTTYYLYNNQTSWTMSPCYFNVNNVNNISVTTTGSFYFSNLTETKGVRPVISLKHETKFSSGTGIATDPYVVE